MKKVEPIRDLDDIERIKDYLKNKSDRNYVLFMFGIYSGLRVSDIVPLQVKQVIADRIELKEKKTGKIRYFPISPPLRKEINRYIKDNQLAEYDYLFPSKKKKRTDGFVSHTLEE